MVRPPTVPQNTPKSDEIRKRDRSNSKFSDTSAEKLKSTKHSGKGRRRLSHISSSSSKQLELLGSSSSKNIHEIHCSCERLNDELRQFVSDFVDSQEYQDYLEFKRSVIRKDQAVQYDSMDLIEDGGGDISTPKKQKKVDPLRALSRKALRVFFLEKQIEKYLENLKNAEILKKQEEAINLIRVTTILQVAHNLDLALILYKLPPDLFFFVKQQKIDELKCIFYCHREEKLHARKKKEQALVRRFVLRHNIDISRMISTNRLDKVILEIERKIIMKKRSHKNNTKIIVEKLLKEYKQNRKEEKKVERIKSKKKSHFDPDAVLHIKGRRGSQYMISSVNIVKKEDAILKAFRDAGVCINERKFEVSGMENLLEKACSTEAPHVTSDKSMQKGIAEISQEDNMFKMKLDDNAKHKLDIMESFVQFEDLLEARHFFCTCERERKNNENAEMNYPDDRSIISSPDCVTFKNIDAGKIYCKKLTLRNISGHPVRIRFFKIYCEDPKYSIYFEVECDEIKIARPGLPVNMTVKFQSPKDTEVIVGTMVFLTCCKATYCRYKIPIECIPAISDITLEPKCVNFGSIPIWTILKSPLDIFRTIKIRSCGKKAHKLIISKEEDPLELNPSSRYSFLPEESSSSDEEGLVVKKTPAILQMEEIIVDILKEIDNRFRLDRKYVVMNGPSREQSLKITLSRIEHPGFYIEKYRVDIYDVLRDGDKYRGMQEIVITLEVPDFFIRCDPTCVDFGICFYGTAYQATFGIENTGRTSHSVTIRIPSALSYYVSLDENCIFVKPGETRRISVKLLPGLDLMAEKSKYFDRDTCILYFPIEVKLVDKKYANAPSIIEHCYAILNDCSDLTVDPQRDHFEDIDGKMVLDMGDCSVSEAITTELVLRNASYSKRYYGFNNLPRWMTIMPKYGFGSINAFQEITLAIFIHPQVEDFRGSEKDEFRQEKNLSIFVETVANLGKYRKKPNMNRLLKLMRKMLAEMRSKMDIDLLESIFVTKINIRTEINLCTCPSALSLRKMSSANTMQEQEDLEDSKREESDMSDTLKPVEDEVKNNPAKTQKKKKRLSIKHHRGEDALKRSDSADSTSKGRRRSSKHKNSTGSPIPSTTVTDEESDEVRECLERQPSLLQKKSVAPPSRDTQTDLPPSNLGDLVQNLSRELRLKVVFVKPMYEFSYNRIEFPVTPGGSYSMMTTELRPLKFAEKTCTCTSGQYVRKPRCRSTFRIAGSTQEIRIEPMYGVLEHGESIKLTLVATPKINDDVIATYAYEDKKKSLYEEKMEKELKRREEALSRRNKKSKTKITLNTKKGNKKRTISIETEISANISPSVKEEEINIEISPEEVQVEYSDLYPAELALWRSIEPYFLNTNFVCHLDYEMEEPCTLYTIQSTLYPDRTLFLWFIFEQLEDLLGFYHSTFCRSHSPDIFSLETVCKVVSPDFIHDQKTQHLDFGQVPIGDCNRKIVTIQNLKYHDISVTTSILRPEGGFFCPNFDSVMLPSECFLKIPITYTPSRNESALEYMEIRAERTVYQFLLSAEAAVPNIRLEPSSKILRAVCKRGKLLEFSFEIVNDSRQPVRVSLEKVCELEGRILHRLSRSKSKSRSDRMLKKKAEIKETSGDFPKPLDGSPKKGSRLSFSDELTEDEIYSIENEFSSTEGFSYFQLSEEERILQLQESSKKTVKIQFGTKSSHENPKSSKKKERTKSMTEVSNEDIGKVYVAKFNLLIGSSYFLRDFIIVAEVK